MHLSLQPGNGLSLLSIVHSCGTVVCFFFVVYRVNVTADYNMDLVIALEMSRLQMIEDEMKKRQRADEDAVSKSQQMPDDSAGQAGTSVESSNAPGSIFHLFIATYSSG